MNVALLVVTVWFALSLLFAAVHKSWIHYAPAAARQPMDFGTKVWLAGLEQRA